MSQARDAKLPMPKLILHALQVNMADSRLPSPESNGMRYLKVFLDAFPHAVGIDVAPCKCVTATKAAGPLICISA